MAPHPIDGVDDGCVSLVDGPVQARLLFFPPDIDVGVPLQESTYDATVTALARVDQVGIAGLILQENLAPRNIDILKKEGHSRGKSVYIGSSGPSG